MILVIKERKNSDSEYINYLVKNNSKCYFLNLEDIINKVKITDYLTKKNISGFFEIDDKVINLNEISGIYHEIYSFPEDAFENFDLLDRDYAKSEWLAYFVYRFSLYEKIINPFHPELFSSPILQLPVILNKARECGLAIPKFIFSTQKKDIEHFIKNHKAILLNNLYQYSNFSEAKELEKNVIGAIEKTIGACVYVHVIPGCIYSTIRFKDGRREFNFPEDLTKPILNLVAKLNLNMAEICFFINTENQLILYYVSPIPEWDNYLGNKEVIWEKITQWLEN